MTELITTPNLPQNAVRDCLIGEKYTEEINELSQLGINCLRLKESPDLETEISSHADILSFNFGNGQTLINKGSIGEEDLLNIGITPIIFNRNISSPYPNDIPLNVAFIGNNLICNVKYAAKEILNFAADKSINIINTNQGYSRCNLCIINDQAVITEDKGLSFLLNFYQFDVLNVSAGDVYLSDAHHGFLGGASCKLSEEEIFFSGNIENHRDYDKIIKFLNKYHVKPIYNKNRILRDFGGIIQLTEEK